MLWEESLIIIRPFYKIIFLVFLILWHEISFFDKVPCKKVFCMFIFLIDELAKMVIQSKKGFFILFLVYAMWYYMYLFFHKRGIHPMWNGRYIYPIHDKYFIYIYICSWPSHNMWTPHTDKTYMLWEIHYIQWIQEIPLCTIWQYASWWIWLLGKTLWVW